MSASEGDLLPSPRMLTDAQMLEVALDEARIGLEEGSRVGVGEPLRRERIDHVLNNSFGMLGINSAVVVRRHRN